MPSLFWNPLSINYLIEIIVIGVLSGFFGMRFIAAWRSGEEQRTPLLLFVTFVAHLIAIALQLLAFSLPQSQVDYVLPWVSPIAAIGMTAFVLHAYYFDGRAATGRRGEMSIILFFLAVIAFEFYVAFGRQAALANGHVLYRGDWTEIPFAFCYLGAPILFFWHLVDALAREAGSSLRAAIRPALAALVLPGRALPLQAATPRAFLYYCFLPLIITAVVVARSAGLISWQSEELLCSWLMAMIFAGFALVYLNYVPERTSFRAKLVGLTLISILTIASGMSWLVGQAYSEAYVDPNRLMSQTAFRFEPQADGSYTSSRMEFSLQHDVGVKLATANQSLDLPFNFGFFGIEYRQLFINKDGMVGFQQVPLWRDVLHKFGPQPAIFVASAELAEDPGKPDSGLYMSGTPDHAVFTWNDMVSANKPDEPYKFQLRLFASGAIEIAFARVPDKPAYDYYLYNSAPMMTGIVPGFESHKVLGVHFASDLPATAQPGEAIMEYRYPAFRAYLNRVYRPMAFYILISSLIIIFVFPLFFQVNLIRPLDEFIGGVRQIMSGKLATNIKVFYRDEIGYLASAFNEMATAQNELVETLEDKVAERTAEASEYAARNARLEERNHLSRELHDAVSQTLFSANLMADKLPDIFRKNPELALERLNQIRQLNQEALVEMRHLLLELRTQKLSNNSFGKLLADLMADIKHPQETTVKLNLDSDAILPPDVQFNFFRIAQESLNNAAKHASASEIVVYFDAVGDQAMLSVSDNGAGFRAEDITPGHMGLDIMRERIERIGGTLEIQSEPGQGTKITATWIKNEPA